MREGIHDAHAAEARERWGDTEAYRESARRTSSYSPDDWARLKAESEEIEGRFATLLAAGEDPSGAAARAAAEDARLHIERWFYPCDARMHAALADMYTGDERFRAHYEDRAQGLASFVATAIRANLARD